MWNVEFTIKERQPDIFLIATDREDRVENYIKFGNGCFFFFFWINNIRILLIIERLLSRVHWGCTMGAQIKKQKISGQEK